MICLFSFFLSFFHKLFSSFFFTVSKRLFPLPNALLPSQTNQTNHPTAPPHHHHHHPYTLSPWTVFALFELTLTTGLLTQASRLLTLCCSCDLLGGLDSRPGCVRALVISSELLYQNLRRLSICSAQEVLQFTFRLEQTVGCFADEMFSGYDISNVILGYKWRYDNSHTTNTIDPNTKHENSQSKSTTQTISSPEESSNSQQQQQGGGVPLQQQNANANGNSIESIITAPVRSFGVYSGAGKIYLL